MEQCAAADASRDAGEAQWEGGATSYQNDTWGSLTDIPSWEYVGPVELITIYDCFCDRTRLRILHLLGSGPLCVCHFQEILDEPQVKISKHLAYLKARGLVEARREGQWMIYSPAAKPSRELSANLACLQDCASEQAIFRKDAERRRKLGEKIKVGSESCCPSKTRISKKICCS